jgi:lipopolysaccharide transport system permease protein
MLPLLEFNLVLFRSLYQRRRIIWVLSVRELKVRYKGSVLGFLWTFMNPLLMMAIYTVIFTAIFKTNIPHYEVYAFSGILLWNTISGCLNDGAACILQNTTLITKAALPPEIFAFRVVLTHFLNYFLTLPLLFGFSLLRGLVPTIHVFQLLYLIPLAMLFMLSVVLGLSVLGAFYRDIQHLVNTMSFALFFTIPVTYTMSMLPEKFQDVLIISPLTQLIQMNADAFIFGKTINPKMLTATLGMTIVFLLISLWIIRKFHTRIAERI